MPIYTLYHGNTETVISDTVSAQKLLDKYKSIGDKHYLGDGYYFYHDLSQAKVWAHLKVTRNENYRGQQYAVLKCEVEVDDDYVMDLDNRDEQDYFFAEMKRLKIQLDNRSLGIEQYCDTYLCNHLSTQLSLTMLTKTFPYKDKFDSFRPLFSNTRPPYGPYNITRHFRTEKQYVLRENYRIIILDKVDLNKEEVKYDEQGNFVEEKNG